MPTGYYSVWCQVLPYGYSKIPCQYAPILLVLSVCIYTNVRLLPTGERTREKEISVKNKDGLERLRQTFPNIDTVYVYSVEVRTAVSSDTEYAKVFPICSMRHSRQMWLFHYKRADMVEILKQTILFHPLYRRWLCHLHVMW